MRLLVIALAMYFFFLGGCKPTHQNKLAIDPTDTTWYSYADTMPQMKNGEKGFENYLKGCIRYPQMEKELGIDGTVYIGFTVEKDGSISYVRVEKGVDNGPGLSKEGIRVVKGMPDWEPAIRNGKAVRMRMVVPIKYILK